MLEIDSLTKTYPGRNGRPASQALGGVSFSVREGEFFTLLGPSGCGKTTTLQSIAGLDTPDSGRIVLGGQTVFDSARGSFVPANKRDLGMVFQSYAIWPHMSVFDNVAFPLQHGPRRVAATNIKQDVTRALEMVQLGHLADRPAPMLSGGQQQRVALARALVHRPRLLLLDEPLSNLDAKLRDTMRNEIRSLVKSVGITTIFVTHDQTEAMGMSDRIVLMRSGAIVQEGTPREIFLRPNSVFTADFMGRSNLVPGRIVTAGPAPRIETPLGVLSGETDSNLRTGDAGIAVIRPQAVSIASDTEAGNCFTATIRMATFLGDVVETVIEVNGQTMTLMLNPYEAHAPGETLSLRVAPERCVIVAADSESVAA